MSALTVVFWAGALVAIGWVAYALRDLRRTYRNLR